MSRRARITFLVEDAQPCGRTVMALRRMAVLAAAYDVAGLALAPAGGRARNRIARAFPAVRSLTGEARLARSDVIVTTGDRTAASAVARLPPGCRVVHVVTAPARETLAGMHFMQSVPRIAGAIVPLAVDPADFARRAGLPAATVRAMPDFVPADESLLGTARGRWIVVAGRITPATRTLVDAFAAALPELPDWRLRVLGGGTAATELDAEVEARGLRERMILPGWAAEIAPHYAGAGMVAAINPDEADGLSVVESLAAGVPVIGSPLVPAVTRLVRDGHNGVVLPRTDVETVAAAFRDLGRDDDRRIAMAARARADRSGLLTREIEADLLAYFAQILAQSPSAGGTP